MDDLPISNLLAVNPTIAAQADGWDPAKVSAWSNKKFSWICAENHRWEASVNSRTRLGAGCPYCSGLRAIPGLNSLADLLPERANEADGWDPTTVKIKSNQEKAWVCKFGHRWDAKVAHRTRGNNNCPYCSGRRVLAGFNDLATTHPEIANEADGWNPTTVSYGSGQEADWICEQGHRWSAKIAQRTLQNLSCQTCSGRVLLVGYNDLATMHPDLATEADGWDPTTVSATSKEKPQWRCTQGHVWNAAIYSRVAGRGCPVCANKQIISGINDLATTHPDLAKEADGWDPTTVSSGHDKSLKWRCPTGHSYLARPYRRTSKKPSNCPVCSNNLVIAGINDLATTHPDIAKQAEGWDPSTVTFGSGTKQQWMCPNGHVWKSTVTSRVGGGSCTVCSNRKIVSGLNDLESIFPDIAKEADGWDPSSIGPGHAKRMPWICTLGHRWNTSPSNRSLQGTRCPVCSGYQLETGFNDLETLFPEVAKEADGWDPTKINAGTNLKKSWRCSIGHRWKATVSSRTSNRVGCPSCAQYGFNPSKQAWLYLAIQANWAQLQVGITNNLD